MPVHEAGAEFPKMVVSAGLSVLDAVSVLVGSAWLAAIRVTICEDAIADGAVYVLPFIDPTFGESDQVTAVLLVPVTVGVNVCVPEGTSVTVFGDTVTAIFGADWTSVLLRLNEAVCATPLTDAVTV